MRTQNSTIAAQNTIIAQSNDMMQAVAWLMSLHAEMREMASVH
jgi:hypothetical protein